MERELSVRETKMVNGMLEGKSRPKAALSAGYSPSYAERFNLHKRTSVKNALIKAMKMRGIDAQRFALVMDEGLSAKRGVVVNGVIQEISDHGVRHKYLETGLKVSGYMKETLVEQDIGIICIPQTLTPEEWNRQGEKLKGEK